MTYSPSRTRSRATRAITMRTLQSSPSVEIIQHLTSPHPRMVTLTPAWLVVEIPVAPALAWRNHPFAPAGRAEFTTVRTVCSAIPGVLNSLLSGSWKVWVSGHHVLCRCSHSVSGRCPDCHQRIHIAGARPHFRLYPSTQRCSQGGPSESIAHRSSRSP